MGKQIMELRNVPNADILNTIRSKSSLDYRERVTEATEANMASTISNIMNYEPTKNEFVAALVNQIGSVVARSVSWQNPLAIFKQGLLEWGDTIEEIQTGLLRAHSYSAERNALERDNFAQEVPDIQTNFHKVNRQEWYKISINDNMLRRAFQSPTGLSKLIAQLMEAPNTSDQVDEFNATCELFRLYEEQGGFYKVNVPDVKGVDSTAAEARRALRALREIGDLMKFPNTKYNAAGMPTFGRTEDIVIFCTPAFKAAMDVEALSAAFNMDQAVAAGRFIVLPEDKFGIPGCQAIMTTADFFIIADVVLQNRVLQNPAGLYENLFLHHHEIISFSRFVPAIMFTTGPGTEDAEITATPVTSVSAINVYSNDGGTVESALTSVTRGAIYGLAAEAITTPAGGLNTAVRYDVEGNNSPATFVRQEGVLYVGGDETADKITVHAISTWTDGKSSTDDAKSSTIELTVTGDALKWSQYQEDPVAATP